VNRSQALARQRAGGGAKRGQVSDFVDVPAPVGGLNARDSIAAMKPTDAVVLDNYVPMQSNIVLRGGTKPFVTGIVGTVESLLPYRDGTGNRMFAAAGGRIYDVTTAGAAGSPAVLGLTNSRFQWVNFGTPGGHFLLAVNGADPMRRFNGTTWGDATGDPGVTGFDTSLAIGINVYGERVWLVEMASFRVWYLPLQSIGGAAVAIDMSSLFRLGGSLASMITWTVAGTTETTQYAVFLSTEGEFVLFTGDDPSNPDTWARAGTGRIAKPVGTRCWTRYGTDVILICADGFVSLSEALQLDRKSNVTAISNKIVGAAGDAVQSYGGNFGWQPCLYPSGSKLIVNVPMSNGQSIQYVMNTNTGAWCRYVGINASCWETTANALFYGGPGGVFQAEVGQDDCGAAITGLIVPAFNYFGSRAYNKRFSQVRVICEAPGSFLVTIDMLTNFDQLSQASTPSLISHGQAAEWNTSPWNVSAWGTGPRKGYAWEWCGGLGFAGAARIQSQTKGLAVSIDAIGYCFEKGDGVY
jgi:hypothetical protein